MKATALLMAGLGRITLTNGFVPLSVIKPTPTVLFSNASTNYVGPVQESVEDALKKEFEPSYLQVINESHGNVEDESHFNVIIVSNAFEDKRLVQRHRLVNGCLMDGGQLPFHALTITAKTQDEWEKDNSVPDSPNCMGGH